MILNFIYDYSEIICLVVLLGVLLLSRRYGFQFMTIEQNHENYDDAAESKSNRNVRNIDTRYCSDENCVRCKRYAVVLDEAFMKLKFVSSSDIAEKVENGIKYAGFDSDAKQRPNVFFYSGIRALPVWKTDEITDCKKLIKSVEAIKREFNKVTKQSSSVQWKRNQTPNGSWDIFHLINQGQIIKDNADMCPSTMDVINSLQAPMLRNVFGNVMFSIVKPGTFITEHYGPTNIRLRCHLGLNIPPDYALMVDDQTVTWSEDECTIFDDSFLHSVSYIGQSTKSSKDCQEQATQPQSENSQGNEKKHSSLNVKNRQAELKENKEEITFDILKDRAVLIVDLWHPELTEEERGAIDLVFAP